MVKEAQQVCIHSSFSKRFEIASTRKLEGVDPPSDDSILRVLKLLMKKKPTFDF